LQKVPMHVHRPDHDELLRVYDLLQRGSVELPA
jgi:acyl-CoA-binding protein